MTLELPIERRLRALFEKTLTRAGELDVKGQQHLAAGLEEGLGPFVSGEMRSEAMVEAYFNLVSLGLRAAPKMRDATEKQGAAYHEGGHVVACLVLGIPFESVSLTPAPNRMGAVTLTNDVDWETPSIRPPRSRVHDRVMMLAAGAEGRRLFDGSADPDGNASDDRKIREALCFLSPPPQGDVTYRMTEWLRAEARELLRRHRPALNALADALYERDTMTADEVRELVQPYLTEEPAA